MCSGSGHSEFWVELPWLSWLCRAKLQSCFRLRHWSSPSSAAIKNEAWWSGVLLNLSLRWGSHFRFSMRYFTTSKWPFLEMRINNYQLASIVDKIVCTSCVAVKVYFSIWLKNTGWKFSWEGGACPQTPLEDSAATKASPTHIFHP